MKIYPFRAIRPDSDEASQVASLPYDVVNREEAAELAKGFPNSFLRVVRSEIELPAEVDAYSDQVYAKAVENLHKMQKAGVLIQDDEPYFYVYRQTMDGREQYGLVCCVHAQDYVDGNIKKHELTRADKEEDRLRHVLETNCNTGPVFLTYQDSGQYEIFSQVCKQAPLYDFVAVDGIGHTVWRMDSPEIQAKLLESFAQVPHSYIADGHHRSAAGTRAALYRAQNNPQHTSDEEYNRFMAILFPADHLKIFDYNRVVQDLNGHSSAEFMEKLGKIFDIEEIPSAQSPGQAQQVNLYLDKKWYACKFKSEHLQNLSVTDRLDVSLLQNLVLKPLLGIDDPRTSQRIDFVGGIRGLDGLQKRVDSGEMACAFAMHPTTITELIDIADAGEIMPPKSTWFEPKLRSGLLIHSLD